MQVDSSSLNFRAFATADQPALWHWLHIALWDPPPTPLRALEVLQHSRVSIYAEGCGRASDVGVEAVVAGEDAWACWMRLPPKKVGLAHVDDMTPQLGIALELQFQRQGLGKPSILKPEGAAALSCCVVVHRQRCAIEGPCWMSFLHPQRKQPQGRPLAHGTPDSEAVKPTASGKSGVCWPRRW